MSGVVKIMENGKEDIVGFDPGNIGCDEANNGEMLPSVSSNEECDTQDETISYENENVADGVMGSPHAIGAHSVGAHSVGAHSVGAHSDGAHSDGAHSFSSHEIGAHVIGVNEDGNHEVRAHEVRADSIRGSVGSDSVGNHADGAFGVGENSHQTVSYSIDGELSQSSSIINPEYLDDGTTLNNNEHFENVAIEDIMEGGVMLGTVVEGELMEGELMEGELMEGEVIDHQLEDENEGGWHFAEATAVEPEVILFAVPADTEGPQWFRDKYVKMGIFGSFTVSAIIILSLAATILLTTTKTDFKAEPTNSPVLINNQNDSQDPLLMGIKEVTQISDESLMRIPNSVQNQAIRWILDERKGKNSNTFQEEKVMMKYILAVFYFSLDGPNWSSAENWLTSESICQWEHIKCKYGELQEISVVDQNLHGQIPVEIIHAISIERIILTNNEISGTIPSSIGNMKNLEILVLSDNNISGNIPDSLVETPIKTLLLDFNHLTGTIPQSIGNAQKLKKLSLSDNKLSGSIPNSISNLMSLEYLGLSENELSGSIPDGIGNMINMTKLMLRNNNLSGGLPTSMSSLKELRILSLQSNELTGTISNTFEPLQCLENLDLTNTHLLGSIPSALCRNKSEKYHKLHVDCKNIDCVCCTRCK